MIDQVIKMKGISLQSRVELSHDKVQHLVEGGSPLQVPQTLFKKDIATNSVFVTNVSKRVAFTSNKRVLLYGSPHLDTLPFGHADL